MAGVANCGVIRATHAEALGAGLSRAAGQIELSEGCTLRLEALTTLEKPIILNGNGALGNTGVLVIAAGVTLSENVDVPAGSAATISVLSGAALFLPDGANVDLDLDSPLTLNVAVGAAALISRPIVGTGDLIKEGAGPLVLEKISTYSGQTIIREGTLDINDAIQPDSPVVLDGGTLLGIGTVGHDQRDRDRRHDQRRESHGDRLMGSGSVTMNPTTTFAVEVNGTAA